MAEFWETKITKIKPNEIRVRGFRIDDLMGKISFTEAIFLLFTGELPGEKVKNLLDAIFISSIDHGVTPPSALAVLNATSTGAALNASVASGVLSINDFHGGAIYNCMSIIQNALNKLTAMDQVDQIAADLVQEAATNKYRIPGIGHRIHSSDPRTTKLFELAQQAGISSGGVRMIQAIARAFEAQGKKLPVNVDGAIAAILIDLQIPQELANAFFIIARLPGLCAHAYEEQTTQPKMRNIHPSYHVYAGIEDREL